MKDFVAIDFETAQPNRASICQIGLVVVKDLEIVETKNILVQPPQNVYWERFSAIHGITPVDTMYAPSFEEVWHEVLPFIAYQNVVAHNGFGFDFPVLAKTLEYYNLEVPEYEKYCTYKIYRKKLSALAEQYDFPLNHHDALSDAKVCAELFLLFLKEQR